MKMVVSRSCSFAVDLFGGHNDFFLCMPFVVSAIVFTFFNWKFAFNVISNRRKKNKIMLQLG